MFAQIEDKCRRIVGKNGVVLRSITRNELGLVRVGSKEWRARPEEEINEGDEVVVIGLRGATLIAKRTKGGS